METTEKIPGSPYIILQDDIHFRLGTDTLMLADFIRLKRGSRVCDLGCGTGALSMLALSHQPDIALTGVDILGSAIDVFNKCIRLNGIEDKFTSTTDDISLGCPTLQAESFDFVISNPPYHGENHGAVNASPALQTARRGCTVSELCRCASRLLKFGGSFFMVYPCRDMVGVFSALAAHRLEPKRLRLMAHSPDSRPSVFFIEAKKGGKPGLITEPMLFLNKNDSSSAGCVNMSKDI